ncbi:gas vesicle protein GvpG [Desulfofundulus sp. TPOSR]|uniref:gas vesicle protein GvpG n=1 Tax=Desulfofundulus sp. TPOSR TaxID=2714340 RepID=UPI00140D75F6|nr:gas vesicle protein GvpG [Desulfofundulus sp. TPOSR]NHM26762.1 gas vesicle protein GvpG [Desulfofundulus sp. TPOSR]
MFLVDDILLFPLYGTAWVIQQIIERAQEELYDPHKVKRELLELQLLYEVDEISEEEYIVREAELLERLRAIREREMAEREGG